MRWLLLLIFLVVGAWWYHGHYGLPFTAPEGLGRGTLSGLPPRALTLSPPEQEPLDRPQEVKKGIYTLTLTHRFALRALVLSQQIYRVDRESALAPVDLALGWGLMSNPRIVDSISIAQRGRFYTWHTGPDPPLPPRQIEVSSTNMHMIPADGRVEHILRSIRRGDVVALEGYLVQVRGPNGYYWNSSTTREDTGYGACEVIYVTRVGPAEP